MSEDVFAILLISSMVLLLYIIRVLRITINHKERYRFNIYKRRLNVKKLGKWYLYIQAFTLFVSKPGGASWLIVLSVPPILISLIAILFFNSGNNDDSKIYNDYESYELHIS